MSGTGKGRGGARAGAGRPAGKYGRKHPLTVKLTKDVLEFLKTRESRGSYIDDNIRQSQEFRQWSSESA